MAAGSWALYTDTATVEMRQWDGIESLGGTAASGWAHTLDNNWRQLYGPPRGGDWLTRHPGDDVRANWWVTPNAGMGRYLRSGIAGTLMVDALLADGSATIVQPAWQHLTFSSLAAGGLATINGMGDLQLSASGSGTVEWRMTVSQNYDKNVFLGFAWDGGAVQPFNAVQVTSSTPVFTIKRTSGQLGTVLSLYVSSDFQYQATAWTGGEVMVVLS